MFCCLRKYIPDSIKMCSVQLRKLHFFFFFLFPQLLNYSRKLSLTFYSQALLVLRGKPAAWESEIALYQLLHIAQMLLALRVKLLLHNPVFVIRRNLSI